MKQMKGVVISGVNQMEVRTDCPLPEKIVPTGALIRPLIWSPVPATPICAPPAAPPFPIFWGRRWAMKCAA